MSSELRSRITVFASACLAGLLAWWILRPTGTNPNIPGLIPLPERVELHRGSFELTPATRIVVTPESHSTGGYFAEKLRKSTGYPLLLETDSKAGSGNILLRVESPQAGQNLEGYKLSVRRDGVSISSPSAAGLFYGVQTLLQLLPVEALAGSPVSSNRWEMPSVIIEDQPRFRWRGLLLDVSRHFFKKEEIKRVLDLMALHKLNVLHWHLTDDQGWRIEIKKYPRLTEVGGWRKSIGFNLDPKSSTAYGPDGRYGGFYTQADVREMVTYAQQRHISIVPELEMPGHATAALSAYPEFSCVGEGYSTDVTQNTRPGVYCTGKEETFKFVEEVLSEVMELFPGKYIHVGGDEVPTQNWNDCPRCRERMVTEHLSNPRELQRYFLHRVAKFLNQHGRTLVGWSEIAEGGLPEGAVLMDWIGGAVHAAAGGHDVVMSPNGYCYLDFYQSRDRGAEPPAIGGFLPLKKVYSFEPIPEELEPRFRTHILGAQANLWTECIPSLPALEYMMFPRLCALSEVVWSPAGARDWEGFNRRLHVHLQRLSAMGVRYRAKSEEAAE